MALPSCWNGFPATPPLKFPDTLFTGNGTDIDNRCGQPLELEEAIFQ